LASLPPTEDAFVREVDEELRQEQLLKVWKHYGKLALIAVALFLAGLAAFLFWRAEQQKAAEKQGETMGALIADVQAARKTDAAKKADELIAGGGSGYRVSGLMTKAALAVDKGDTKGAAAIFAGIAADEDVAQPYRDIALIRQTLLEYDTLPPQQIIDRLKSLTIEGHPFYATAGEMTAIAMLQLNRTAEAGRLLAAVARDKEAPDTLRVRAARLATSLGVNVDEAAARATATAPADKD
jgi:hypothetical protein